MDKTKLYTAAEVTFTEDPRGSRWTVRILSPKSAEGWILGRPVAERHGPVLTIREAENGYEWTTPGEWKKNGNRHEWAPDLNTAQARIQAWASRRFRTLA